MVLLLVYASGGDMGKSNVGQCGNNLKVVLCDNIVAVVTNNFKLRILYSKTVTKS